MFQPNLLLTKELSKNYIKKFELLFSLLKFPSVGHSKPKRRPPHPQYALLNALIYKNLRSIPTLLELTSEIRNHPQVAQICGFSSFPSIERFSSFLKDTPNQILQTVRETLVKELVKLSQISGRYISVDSCPIKANVKENNLKTTVANRFDKTRIPKGDPDARLSAYVIFPDKKKVQFFWGYRNFILNDAVTELPIAEVTEPANIYEQHLVIPQLKHVKKLFKLPMEAVLGDSAFDAYNIIEFIVKKLKAKPVISKNPRRSKNPDIKLSRKGIPTCVAGFEMVSRGKFYDKEQNRMRHKFVCPIKAGKKFARKLGWFCPWNHPKFFSNRYGCTTNLRIDVDTSIRQNIDYGSQTFKKLYNLRGSTERIFSRLLSILMQRPSVVGINATRNVCTIAHITVLVIALAAVKTGHKDKVRFVKSFIPNL
jgi:transposase